MHMPILEIPGSAALSAGSILEILLIDDDHYDLTRMKRLASKVGKNVTVTGCSTVEGMNKVLDHKEIDICLLDLKLGAVDGVDVVKQMRLREDCRDLPVVMISGMQDTDSVVKTIKAGCANFLEKDHLTADKLRSVIFEALTVSLPDQGLTKQLQQATDQVIRGIADGCISELQPRLRQIYRQVSFIRQCHNAGHLPSPEALDQIEGNCLAMWRFFDEVEAYGNSFSATKH